MKKIKAFFFNLGTSGKFEQIDRRDIKQTALATKYIIFNSLVFAGMAGLLAYAIVNMFLQNVNPIMVYIDLGFFSIICVLTIIARTKINLLIPAGITIALYAIFSWYMIFAAPTGIVSPLWAFLLPVVSMYLLSVKFGNVFFYITFAVLLLVFYLTDTYESAASSRFIGVYFLIHIMTMLAGSRTESVTKVAQEIAELLQEETDELNAMRDNIDLGVFLMNSRFTLEPLYSKHLNIIFEKEDLVDADFISLFKESLTSKEIEILYDYLHLLFVTADTSMLESINPLNKTVFKGKNGEKHLSVTLTKIKKHGEDVLLGTVKDITKETELERQIAEETAERDSEMKVIREVVHTSPEVLAEFISDAQFEFNNINTIMKSNDSSHDIIVQQVYQGVHSLKSNALLVGLQLLGDKLHAVETQISDSLARGVVYDDIIAIAFSVENVMSEIDTISNVMKKLETFSAAETSGDSKEIFIKGIINIVDKIKAEENKFIELKTGEIEWKKIKTDKRRDVKDIVIQLVRNACVHGIETVEERTEKQKNEFATLTLAITEENNKHTIFCSDDGRGIDYEKILQKGKSLGILEDTITVDDKAALINAMLSPTFSTANEVSQHAGRGVGLSLVMDRIKKYNGKIKVKSESNEGTTFVVEI